MRQKIPCVAFFVDDVDDGDVHDGDVHDDDVLTLRDGEEHSRAGHWLKMK